MAVVDGNKKCGFFNSVCRVEEGGALKLNGFAGREGFKFKFSPVGKEKQAEGCLIGAGRSWKRLRLSPFPSGVEEAGNDEAAKDEVVLLQNLILNLPQHLVVSKVLPCLPLPKILELRCVSHAWNSLLCSPHFLQQSIAAQQKHPPWLVMARKSPGPNISTDQLLVAKEFIAYVPSLGRWFPFPLHIFPHISSLLGSHLEFLEFSWPYHLQKTPANFHMTSAGGLVCCMSCNVSPFSLLVFNPLTGNMKILPPYPWTKYHSECICLSMLHDQDNNSYKVVVSRTVQEKWCYIQVYDSKTDSWKVITPQISATSNMQNADLFFYIHEKDDRRAYTYYRLYGYHMESNSWSSLIVPAPNKLLRKRNGKFFLKKLNGRVLLAFDFRPPWAPAALQGFTIWELNYSSSDSSAASWVQVARTPPKFWNRFHDVYDTNECANDTSYITNGRLICMTAVDFEDEHYGGNYASPLVYDLVLNSWYQLPPYIKGGTGFMGLFSFLPTSNIAK